MFKNILFLFFTLLYCFSCKAQEEVLTKIESKSNNTPKLVVGIVVDQMRYDYLTRFYNKYSDGGFKRMMNEGFNCKNNHFNYIPTKTGPGHASVFTGTTPKYHGVIANDWFDKDLKSSVNCVGDNSVEPVGTLSANGKKSPHRLLATTFSDENRLFTQMRGKAIGISFKDRGAILPIGHTANAAYWFHGMNEGHWISSSFYMNELPKWVNEFNASDAVEKYFKIWDTFYDIDTYIESGNDLNTFEGGFSFKKTATFPYDLSVLKNKKNKFDAFKPTAYGNSITTDFALAAVKGEQLGKDNITDVLTISFSSTDAVGHNFGVNSKEIEDTYIRLDKDLERFFNALDAEVGKGNYTVFLTADHGVVHIPNYLKSLKIPSGYVSSKVLMKKLDAFIFEKFELSGLITSISNNQIFLDRDKIKVSGLDLSFVQESIVNEIMSYEDIYKAYSGKTMNTNSFSYGLENLLQNGYNQKRSGDILTVPYPGHIFYRKTGTTHGSGFNYDTHVPLLFFGKGIKPGETLQKTVITDIAPTISALLGISFPSASIGNPLEFVLK